MEKIFNAEETVGNQTDIDISDLLILDELSDKLSEKSLSIPSQKKVAAVSSKEAKLFFPILPSERDILTTRSKNEFFINSQKDSSTQNIENNNKEKDFYFKENEINIQPKDNFSFDNKNSTFLFNDFKNLPIHHFSRLPGSFYKSDENSVKIPKFPPLKHLPEHSLTLTSIFISPNRKQIKAVDTKSIKMNSRFVDKNIKKFNTKEKNN